MAQILLAEPVLTLHIYLSLLLTSQCDRGCDYQRSNQACAINIMLTDKETPAAGYQVLTFK